MWHYPIALEEMIHESGKQVLFSATAVLQLHGIPYRTMPQQGSHWKATNNDIIGRRGLRPRNRKRCIDTGIAQANVAPPHRSCDQRSPLRCSVVEHAVVRKR